MLTTVFSIIGTLQLFAEPQILSTVAPAIDTEYTPNYAAYTNAFAFNEYGVASAQAVIIALAAFISCSLTGGLAYTWPLYFMLGIAAAVSLVAEGLRDHSRQKPP